MTDKVVVTGVGVVSAIGIGKAETLQSLLNAKTGIGQVRYLHTEHNDMPVGEVKLSNEELMARVEVAEDEGKQQSRNAMIARLALREALVDAGLTDDKGELDKTMLHEMPLISGTTVAGMDRAESIFNDPTQEVMREQMLESRSDCGTNTEEIARGIGHFAMLDTISTACSSAANAIAYGANLIKTGLYQRVVVGGSESLSKFHFNGFNTLMILDREQCRPFDETRAGLNLGEGAAYLVIESEASALNRGKKPLATLSCYGNACDAFHQTASSTDGEGAFLAMSKALDMGGLKPADIDYINAHGTGTPNNDPSELYALKRLFGESIPPYSSTKSFTGHTTSASGSIEAVFCILAIEHQFLPINLNCEKAIEGYPHPVTKGDKPGRELRNVLCNAFGFGGNDTSLVLSKYQQCKSISGIEEKQDIHPFKPVYVLASERLGDIDPDFKQYMTPGEARRLGRLLKRDLALSADVVKRSGIDKPDAIITATTWGSYESSEQFLSDLIVYGEQMLKPTHFIQSTHNTLAALVAISTKNHGYNCTHSQGKASLELSVLDAWMQLQLGEIKTALVSHHDALPEMVNSAMVLSTEIPEGVTPVSELTPHNSQDSTWDSRLFH